MSVRSIDQRANPNISTLIDILPCSDITQNNEFEWMNEWNFCYLHLNDCANAWSSRNNWNRNSNSSQPSKRFRQSHTHTRYTPLQTIQFLAKQFFFSHLGGSIHKTHLTDEWNRTQLIIMKNTDTINTRWWWWWWWRYRPTNRPIGRHSQKAKGDAITREEMYTLIWYTVVRLWFLVWFSSVQCP